MTGSGARTISQNFNLKQPQFCVHLYLYLRLHLINKSRRRRQQIVGGGAAQGTSSPSLYVAPLVALLDQ